MCRQHIDEGFYNTILHFIISLDQTSGQFNSGIAYFKNGSGTEIDKIGIEVCYKKFNPQINLPFSFLIQKYFFHDNPIWNINYSE